MALKIVIQVLISYLKLTCEYELHIFSNTKVGAPKDHGENCMKVWPPLVCHLLSIRLLLYKVNAQNTIVKRCLNDTVKLKKSIFVKNPIAHSTLKISVNQSFGTYAVSHKIR